jgi:hypothetical protein
MGETISGSNLRHRKSGCRAIDISRGNPQNAGMKKINSKHFHRHFPSLLFG